ncbi:CBN-PES-8 protein [Caenorhabditis brenneri]|uniref:CBN-PES-8 protein n=1 Tax=Caenorhabditis brenneri TaxID=135651 RepID=G0MGT9_CAEBE|nr:CBN-PES-8 protein [Caenorhabditis brenneri]
MLSLRHFSLLFFLAWVNAEFGVPELRVGQHEADIMKPIASQSIITHYVIGETYTFEVFLDETTQHDYVIESCTMNNEKIIGPYGCVDCGNCITKSIETESYNKPGAIKRTLVEFIAHSPTYQFRCDIKKLYCSGCAERSCQRQSLIPWNRYQSKDILGLMYPPENYAIPPMGAFPIPIPHNIYPTPPIGGFHMPPQAPPIPPPVGPPAPPAPYNNGGLAGVWPWWVWLLILLLLLLLLCCLLALCFAAFMKRRKEKKTTTAVTVVDGKDCAVGTDHVAVTCVGTDTQDIVKVQPAMVLGAENLEQHHHQQHLHNQYSRNQAEYDQGSVMAGGSYSLREGMIHEGYTRTLPRESSFVNDRYASRDRFDRNSADKYTDRSSYRNYAYERDMAKVEPMDGFDEVETRERTYCLSDDDQEIVEKNVKRTHTTRYITESREYEPDHDNEERLREDEYHHASYTHSLPV